MPRLQSECDCYHIYSRGSGRQIIFEDDEDRCAFLDALAKALTKADAELFAFCLMGTHYHLVVRSGYESLPALGYSLNRSYAGYFNDRHDRSGHLFQDRYCSQPINGDEHLLAAIRYVHRNPVEANMSKTCSYPWSSFECYCQHGELEGKHMAGGTAFVPVSTNLVLDMLGSVSAFIDFHMHSGKETFLDDYPSLSQLSETEMVGIARTLLGTDPSELKSLAIPDRNQSLRLLKTANFTLSQIAILTGISRSVVGRACQL